MTKKILFLSRTPSIFSYYKSTIEELCLRGNMVEVCFLNYDDTSPNGSRYYFDINAENKEIILENAKLNLEKVVLISESTNLKFGMYSTRNDIWTRLIGIIRELITRSSYIRRNENSVYSIRQKRYLENYLSRYFKFISSLDYILKSKSFFRTLQFIHSFMPKSNEINKFLRIKKPDVLVVTPANLSSRWKRFSSETDYLYSAKKLKIPTVVPVLSWDNLTTKGFMHHSPTITLAWNKIHLQEAVKIHDIKESQVIVTGSPFFDKWFDESIKESDKKKFFIEAKLDFNKPFVLYLGSSKTVSQAESKIVLNLFEKLKNNNIQLLIRPHGHNVSQFDDVKDIIPLYPSEGGLPDNDISKQVFFNSMKYSIATVGINNSAMIDSLINYTPCITIIDENHHKSQLNVPHFQHLKNYNLLYEVKDVSSCTDLIKQLIEKGESDNKKELNRQFIKEFIRPYGIKKSAGYISARSIELTGEGFTVDEIKQQITNF